LPFAIPYSPLEPFDNLLILPLSSHKIFHQHGAKEKKIHRTVLAAIPCLIRPTGFCHLGTLGISHIDPPFPGYFFCESIGHNVISQG
jgi:hypothetical protein